MKVLWASLVGTSLESYDFYVFSYLAAFFLGPLFFEPLGVFGGFLAAFLTNALGFVARPLGAIVFGQLGDRIGRRKTLIVTVTMMGVATGLIGVLPDYATAGYLGAVLLVSLRLLQGLSLAGEWGGAVLLASEHGGPKRHGFYASIPQLGSPIGSILTAAIYLALPVLLSSEEILAWGWRIPFLVAFPLLAVSLWLRLAATETPVFEHVLAEERRERIPLLTAFRKRPVALLLATGAALLGIGSYSLMNTYTLEYGFVQLGYDYNQLLLATTIGALLQLVTIPLFGAWANRIGSARVVLIGAIGTLLVAFPIYFLLPDGELRRAGRDDDHRRHPAHDELGGSRRPAVGAVRRALPLRGDLVRIRGRGDHQRLRAGDHARVRRGDRVPVVAPGDRARRDVGDHRRVGIRRAQAHPADRRDLALRRTARSAVSSPAAVAASSTVTTTARPSRRCTSRASPPRVMMPEPPAETPPDAEAAELPERNDVVSFALATSASATRYCGHPRVGRTVSPSASTRTRQLAVPSSETPSTRARSRAATPRGVRSRRRRAAVATAKTPHEQDHDPGREASVADPNDQLPRSDRERRGRRHAR